MLLEVIPYRDTVQSNPFLVLRAIVWLPYCGPPLLWRGLGKMLVSPKFLHILFVLQIDILPTLRLALRGLERRRCVYSILDTLIGQQAWECGVLCIQDNECGCWNVWVVC